MRGVVPGSGSSRAVHPDDPAAQPGPADAADVDDRARELPVVVLGVLPEGAGISARDTSRGKVRTRYSYSTPDVRRVVVCAFGIVTHSCSQPIRSSHDR